MRSHCIYCGAPLTPWYDNHALCFNPECSVGKMRIATFSKPPPPAPKLEHKGRPSRDGRTWGAPPS